MLLNVLLYLLGPGVFHSLFFMFLQPTPVATYSAPCDFFTTDQLENVYAVDNNKVTKFNHQLNNKQVYSNKLLGEISSIDALNPMQVLLFYKATGNLVFLDNTLSVKQQIDLRKQDVFQPTLACASTNNSFWVYDENTLELTRFNNTSKITQTGNIAQLIGFEPDPIYMQEINDRLYIYDVQKGLLVFDIFGTYLKTLPFYDVKNVQIQNNSICFSKGEKIEEYLFSTKSMLQHTAPKNPFEQMRMTKKHIYLLNDNVVSKFGLIENN